MKIKKESFALGESENPYLIQHLPKKDKTGVFVNAFRIDME